MQISFSRIYRPYWLTALVRKTGSRQSRIVKAPKLRASEADAAWQECIDRDLYGANTPDYSMKADATSKRH